MIGKVGAQTRGVEKMLRRIGFRYAERVDPFDGGPHFTAPTDEVSLVQRTRKINVEKLLPNDPPKERALVAVSSPEPPFFRAVLGPWKEIGEDGGAIGEYLSKHLGLDVGSQAWVLPLE